MLFFTHNINYIIKLAPSGLITAFTASLIALMATSLMATSLMDTAFTASLLMPLGSPATFGGNCAITNLRLASIARFKNCLSATEFLTCGIIDFTLNVEVRIKSSICFRLSARIWSSFSIWLYNNCFLYFSSSFNLSLFLVSSSMFQIKLYKSVIGATPSSFKGIYCNDWLYHYQIFFFIPFTFYAYSFVDVSCPVTRLMNVSPSSSSFKLSMCLSRCRNKKFTMADMGSCFSLIAA